MPYTDADTPRSKATKAASKFAAFVRTLDRSASVDFVQKVLRLMVETPTPQFRDLQFNKYRLRNKDCAPFSSTLVSEKRFYGHFDLLYGDIAEEDSDSDSDAQDAQRIHSLMESLRMDDRADAETDSAADDSEIGSALEPGAEAPVAVTAEDVHVTAEVDAPGLRRTPTVSVLAREPPGMQCAGMLVLVFPVRGMNSACLLCFLLVSFRSQARFAL